MIDKELKKNLRNRLRRAEGQVAGIGRMVEEDRYCIEVLTQIAGSVAALLRVRDLVLENHMRTCVAQALRSDSEREQDTKIAEVMGILSKFGGLK